MNIIELPFPDLTYYPSHISVSLAKIFGSTSRTEQRKQIVEYIERVLEHLFSFCLARHVHEKRVNDNYSMCREAEFSVLNYYGSLSLGTMLAVTRKLNVHFTENLSHKPEILYSFEDLDQSLGALINYRNELSHGRFKEDSHTKLYEEFLRSLELIKGIKKSLIFVPMSINSHDETYDGYVFSGTGSSPFYCKKVRIPPGKLALQQVYHINAQSGNYFELSPLWHFMKKENDKGLSNLLLYTTVKNKKAILQDHMQGISIDSKDHYNEYMEFLSLLSPDYNYQKDPYLKGHSICINKQTINLELKNPEGDLNTTISKEVQMIAYKGEHCSNEKCLFDYHDAPIYPIDDETFNLKINEKNNKPIELEYEIKNDAFRKFSVILKKMKFEEKREIQLSCYEPMLFSNLTPTEDEYYEIEIEQPTKLLCFSIRLPIHMEIINYRVEYLDGNPINNKNKSGRNIVSVRKLEGGEQIVSFSIKKPIVGKQIVFYFNVKNCSGNYENKENSKLDKFRAGYQVYKIIKDSNCNEWTVDESEGNIIIRARQDANKANSADAKSHAAD